MAQYCHRCGSQLPRRSAYCPSCGVASAAPAVEPSPSLTGELAYRALDWGKVPLRGGVPRGLALIVAVVIVGVIVLPLGPDVPGSAVEASFRRAVEREAPPSNRKSGIKALECPRHWIWNNASRACKLEQEIALAPDASAVYDVDIRDDGCWVARLNEEDSDTDSLLVGERFKGCVR